MRFLVDVPDDDLRRLDDLARSEAKSRAAVLREAVANYLAEQAKDGFERYFGLWERNGSSIDGLAYERQFRDDLRYDATTRERAAGRDGSGV